MYPIVKYPQAIEVEIRDRIEILNLRIAQIESDRKSKPIKQISRHFNILILGAIVAATCTYIISIGHWYLLAILLPIPKFFSYCAEQIFYEQYINISTKNNWSLIKTISGIPNDYKSLLSDLPERLELIKTTPLEEYFAGYLFERLSIIAYGSEFFAPGDIYPFHSDFEIHTNNNKHIIQISIDRPYTDNKKLCNLATSKQDRRWDATRLAMGYVVIRFSEFQITRAPLACCAYIAIVSALLDGIEPHQIDLKAALEVPLDLPWDKTTAQKMLAHKFRKTCFANKS